MSKRKGSIYERELLAQFHERGFSGVRVAGSGSSQFPSPDLVVGKDARVFAVEVKATRKKSVYVANEQLTQLMLFAKNFGCTPLIGVKFIGFGWRFFPPHINVEKKLTRFCKQDSTIDHENVCAYEG
ncbi:Holliday junction resolvase [archaeon CG10_big_fil_rev_8_21_14_0_10_43_11]|nr:MAG: Holliday junction resolvase [archaeon CG10_big_fil_rev_8_21_14_0_10_43_11]